MENEMYNFFKVWFSVFLSLYYCYIICKRVPKGAFRFLLVLPIVSLFMFLPLMLHSITLGGGTAFFIAWLATFKLLLLAFGKGPLCSNPPISLARFMAIGCLPIQILNTNSSPNLYEKLNYTQFEAHPSFPNSILNDYYRANPYEKSNITQNETHPSLKSHLNDHIRENPDGKLISTQTGTHPYPVISHLKDPIKESHSAFFLTFVIKGMILAVLIGVIDFKAHLHPMLLLCLYCLYIYLLLENLSVMATALARVALGVEIEPHFNKPYLSASLQDFWGNRWNLMVTKILRPAVYEPTRDWASTFLGRKWALVPAVVASFAVSGIMHELIYYYIGRVWPTWEVTCFFILHGLSLCVEIGLKKAFRGRWRLPWLISGPLTVGFVIGTGYWLFFPQFLRCRAVDRMLEEYATVGAILRDVTRPLIL